MEKRLLIIKQVVWFVAYCILGTIKGEYFTSNVNFATFEHKTMMQVHVFEFYFNVCL